MRYIRMILQAGLVAAPLLACADGSESGAFVVRLGTDTTAVEVYTRACPLFVPLAEEGWTDGAVVEQVAETYLGTLARSGIDTLILGCTHYPLLKKPIASVLGPGVALVDSAEETARDVRALLEARQLLRPGGRGSTSFFVTDVPERFVEVGARFLGRPIPSAEQVDLSF